MKNLTAADFRIYEDGTEQKIEVFAIEADRLASTPSAAASSTPAAPAVFSNRLAERPAGGVTVILFDRLNSTQEDHKSARDHILKLLANIRSSDRVALYVLESDTITVRNSRARLDALGHVMQSPIEASGISLTAEIARTRNEGTVVVHIDPESLTWEQAKDVREAAIDVVIAQSVAGGKYFTIKETTVNLTADAERYRQMVEDGLTLSSNFTTVTDAYRLHVIISDVASQSLGSLIIPIKK